MTVQTRPLKNKVLFFDIDGTLVDDNTKKAPDSIYEAMRLAKENGHYTFINTGRVRCFAEPLAKQLGARGLILGCGTQIVLDDEVMMEHRIPIKRCEEIKEMVRYYDLDVAFEAQEGYYYSANPFKHNSSDGTIDYIMKNTDTWRVNFLEDEGTVFDKFCVCINENGDNKGLMEFLSRLTDFTNTYRGTFYEVVPRGFSKATGIQYVLNKLGLSYEDAYVFGDSGNDLPMFQSGVRNRIMMKDHAKILEEYATYEAGGIFEDGIYKAMKHFNLI